MSVVIAAYNAGDFIESAIESALAQTLAAIEVVVVDDCSSDNTLAVVRGMALRDARVRAFRLDRNSGPGGARNFGVDMARGEWLAVLDSDDLMAPDRLERMVASAVEHAADIIADDLVIFDDSGSDPPRLLMGLLASEELTLARYLEQTVIYGSGIAYGFLKPMFRRSALIESGIGYDERLRIAEDDDLIVRLLGAGLRYVLVADAGYGYRKHANSISHRLSYKNAAAMLTASERLMATMPDMPAMRRRHRAFERAAAFAWLVESLKQRQWRRALAAMVAHPAMWPLLRMPISGKLQRFAPKRAVLDPRAEAALARLRGGAGR